MMGIGLKDRPRMGRMWERIRATAAGRRSLDLGAALAGGFLLSVLSLAGRPLPLAACLVLTASSWPEKLFAAIGAGGGYLLFFDLELALEPLALLICLSAAAVIFRNTAASLSTLSAVLTAAVGVVFLLDTGLGPRSVVRLVVTVAMAWAAPIFLSRAARDRLLAGLRSAPDENEPPADLAPEPGVERVLNSMHGILAREDPLIRPVQLAEVYDFAADRVCKCCVCNNQCWQQCAEDTYHDLCAAGEAAMLRGAVLREDLPQRFLDRCRHTEGFLTAVNQAMDEGLAKGREARRLAEGRRVAAGQYLLLSRLLHTLTLPTPSEPLAYYPEMAVGTACRTGNRVSGDRGATCKDRFGNFYVILCDGMGTGPAARTESDRAARYLTGLLEAGTEADGAMALLNDFYILRRQTVFSTVDLLKLDLHTGTGTLYKWGAAPSYVRSGDGVKKIGTVTTPPGLDTGGSHVPGQYALSLKEGETLVMVSDGAFGEETEQRLTEVTQGTVRDLASCLITMGEADAADDRTAIVLRLKAADSRLQTNRKS